MDDPAAGQELATIPPLPLHGVPGIRAPEPNYSVATSIPDRAQAPSRQTRPLAQSPAIGATPLPDSPRPSCSPPRGRTNPNEAPYRAWRPRPDSGFPPGRRTQVVPMPEQIGGKGW